MAAAAQSKVSNVSRLLAPYQRITSSGQFIPEIDGLRFIAIFSVYIYHLTGDVLRRSVSGPSVEVTTNWFFSVTQVLNIGVPLFFVISGFILALPFAEAYRNLRKPVSLKKYFLRRVTRLEPPYFLALLLLFFLKIAAGKGTALSLWPHLMASLFYVHNPIYGRPSDINFVAWSLEIEVQFYILAPVLALVFAIQNSFARRSLLAALVTLSSAVSQAIADHARLQLTLLGYAQYFLVGFLLAEFYLSRPRLGDGERIWDIVAFAGWPVLLVLTVRGGALAQWLDPILIFVLYVATFQGVMVRRFLTLPGITTIGGMCYTIYLLHNYAIATVGSFTERFTLVGPFGLRLLAQFFIITPCVLALCAVYFRFIERPCMRPDWTRRMKLNFSFSKSQPVGSSAS